VILAETYTGLLTDPAHILFELTWEAITLALGVFIGRKVMPLVMEKFHRNIDELHGIEHAKDGKPYSVDELRQGLEHAVAIANQNARAFAAEKERADAIAETLARELRKSQ
jgi:hypothetical protein